MTDKLPPRYRKPERIARGGMGEIYRVEDGVLGRIVAVKLLGEQFADDENIRRRFTREALAAARLSNAPNTVTIFDVGEHEGRPYIVMELLGGGSLADRLAADGAQSPRQALPWLRQTAAALDAAHAKGVVHRDVKPANLLLDDDGQVKVADFGIASAVGLDSFTQAGTVLGTAGYLSPEQARGERAGPESDRYALAVVAYELLTGKRPFASESATAEAAAHVHAPIPQASEAGAGLPEELDAVFARGLAKDPAERYPTAADFVVELREALDEAAGKTTVGAIPATAATRQAPVAAARQRRRNPVPLLAALFLVLGLGGAALAAALVGGGDDGTAAAPPKPKTIKQTVTAPGTTVVQTVTTPTEPPATTASEPTPEPTPEPTSGSSASALNDQGYRLMQAGDFESALPLLEQAVQGLSGSGSTTEAYASYNLAYTRLALGQCGGVVDLLERSEDVQGKRKEISRLKKEAEKACGD